MANLNNNNTITETPIVHKMRELYKLFYGYLALFPKKDKYGLGSKCEQYIIASLELLLAAGSASKEEKMSFLRQTNVKFDALKIFLRLAHELRLLDNKKYLALQTHIQEVGRMLGGWQRSLL